MNEPEPRTVEIERRIKASPETLFEFFVHPLKYQLWMGIGAVLDPTPGGGYRVDFTPKGGVRGEFLEVDPPRRVVFTWGWESTVDLPPGIGEVAPGSTTVEITLTPDGDETILRLRHSGLPTAEARGIHGSYWPIYLERLATVASGEDAGPDPVYEMVRSMRNPGA